MPEASIMFKSEGCRLCTSQFAASWCRLSRREARGLSILRQQSDALISQIHQMYGVYLWPWAAFSAKVTTALGCLGCFRALIVEGTNPIDPIGSLPSCTSCSDRATESRDRK